jgi:hypothetical protein
LITIIILSYPGHGSEYFTDGWNLLDLAGCLNIFVVVAICGGSYTGAQQSSAFRIIASMGCVSVWLKVSTNSKSIKQ